ncbi:MAG TPA: hypothetical protein VJ276_25300, partial [Thermoanaerobaculia bacterium]|nr:hypothetical protein [Thermoanaerobaculia bacterium]
ELAATAQRLLRRAPWVAAAGALAIVLALHVAAISVQLPRPLDHDEGEYLHASWLLSQGKQLYRDFMEDHPPYLYQLLNVLRPTHTNAAFPLLDVPLWAARGRIVMSIIGTLAASCAALLAWRAARHPIAGLMTFCVLLGSDATWTRGLLEMRADAPALFLFWLGAVLILWDDGGPLRSGIGIALVAASQIWNPKWPLESFVLGIFYLRNVVRRPLRLAAAFLPGVAMLGILVFLLTRATTLRDYVYFNFLLKSANMEAFRTNLWVWMAFKGRDAFYYTSEHFRGVWPVVGIVALLLLMRRAAGKRQALAALLLACTAFLELRFLYTWPRLWPQYYLMWAFTLAVVYGAIAGIAMDVARRYFDARPWRWLPAAGFAAVLALWLAASDLVSRLGDDTPAIAAAKFVAGIVWLPLLVIAAAALARRGDGEAAASILGTLLATLSLVIAATGLVYTLNPWPPSMMERWAAVSYMQRSLRPGETVWVGASSSPIAAPDSSYFWYSAMDLVPMTIGYIATHPQSRAYLPRIAERDLPPCAIVDGRDTTTRFIDFGNWLKHLPELCRCSEQLLLDGRLVPTRFRGLYEVRRPPVPVPPDVAQKIRAQMQANCTLTHTERQLQAEIRAGAR